MNDISAETSQAYILIVDDQPDNLRLLSTMLTQAGYNVKNAISAQMALRGMRTALPELILLDIMMPDMNGFELCQKLKADAQTQDIAVIFLSGLDDELDKVRAFEVGGSDYITKPFQMKEVLARVKNQLTIVRQQQRITEQNLQLQQQNLRLQQLNSELVRSNKDLEEFAYIASHDLRSPLQTMKLFAQLLVQKYQSVLDEKANRYISRILEAGNCMEQLIQDLLNYSRLGTPAKDFELTDCNRVLEQVLANLQAKIQATDAVITHDELPSVMGNATQLTQLFQNLIDNAIKFRCPDVPPQVKISVERKDSLSNVDGLGLMVDTNGNQPLSRNDEPQLVEWVFGVHDNGIGMEPKYFERIFQIFQRLHTSEEYPGTGIGLAVCKKIIERHGGNIWVESSPGLGTTFYFTIPLQPLSH